MSCRIDPPLQAAVRNARGPAPFGPIVPASGMGQAATAAPLRSPLERLQQTLWFEALGLALVAPLHAWATDSAAMASLGLLLALSVLVMAWSAVYNTLFDHWEWRRHRRVASDRPPGLRTLHAIGLEATVVLLSCPLIMALTGLGFWPALGLDLALSAVYAAYGWAFHWGYDRLRPVGRGGAPGCTGCAPGTMPSSSD